MLYIIHIYVCMYIYIYNLYYYLLIYLLHNLKLMNSNKYNKYKTKYMENPPKIIWVEIIPNILYVWIVVYTESLGRIWLVNIDVCTRYSRLHSIILRNITSSAHRVNQSVSHQPGYHIYSLWYMFINI